MNIILFQPEIPQNTGNIARLCAVTGTHLTLVRPLGFSTASRHLKRAGLDYWDTLALSEIDDLPPFLKPPFFFFSSKATRCYTEAAFTPESQLIFGSETSGLPAAFHQAWPEHFYRVPMIPHARCLNLSSTAAIVLYEALRQNHFSFKKMQDERENGATEQ